MLGKTASRTSRPSRSDREFTGDSERRNLSLPFGSEQRADERRNLPLPFGSKERPDEAPAPAPPSPSRSRLGLVSIFPPPPPPFSAPLAAATCRRHLNALSLGAQVTRPVWVGSGPFGLLGPRLRPGSVTELRTFGWAAGLLVLFKQS